MGGTGVRGSRQAEIRDAFAERYGTRVYESGHLRMLRDHVEVGAAPWVSEGGLGHEAARRAPIADLSAVSVTVTWVWRVLLAGAIVVTAAICLRTSNASDVPLLVSALALELVLIPVVWVGPTWHRVGRIAPLLIGGAIAATAIGLANPWNLAAIDRLFMHPWIAGAVIAVGVLSLGVRHRWLRPEHAAGLAVAPAIALFIGACACLGEAVVTVETAPYETNALGIRLEGAAHPTTESEAVLWLRSGSGLGLHEVLLGTGSYSAGSFVDERTVLVGCGVDGGSGIVPADAVVARVTFDPHTLNITNWEPVDSNCP